MTTAFASLIEAAMPSHERWFGVVVKLFRGKTLSDDYFVAVLKAKNTESIDHKTGLPVKFVCREYTFLKTSLTFADVQSEPAAGMLVIEYSGGSGTPAERAVQFNAETVTPTELARFQIAPPPGSSLSSFESAPGDLRWIVRADKMESP